MMKRNELNLCANVTVDTDHFECGLLRTLYYVYRRSYVFILHLLRVIFHSDGLCVCSAPRTNVLCLPAHIGTRGPIDYCVYALIIECTLHIEFSRWLIGELLLA